MKLYHLSSTDLNELKSICEILFVRFYPDVKLKSDEDHALFKDQLKPTSKIYEKYVLGMMLGYAGKTIYDAIAKQAVSERSLKIFEQRIQNLDSSISESETEKSEIIQSAHKLLKRIESQDYGFNKENKSNELSKMLGVFKNATFYIYERFYQSIARKVIKFGDIKNNEISVTIQTAEEGMYPWEGRAYTDASNDFMCILTHNSWEEKSLLANYLIRINSKAQNMDLCIGHMSFISRATNNVITKCVILERITDKSEEIFAKEYKLDEIIKGKTIPDEIYKFLYDRKLNRLPSPHTKIISSKSLLKEWQEENIAAKRESRNRKIEGKYRVWYAEDVLKDDLKYDELVISESDNGDVISCYSHEVDPGKPQIWEGEVFYSIATRSMFLSMQGPKKIVTNSTSAIYLILNFPPGERDFNFLTGIVAGVRDDYMGPISMIVGAYKYESLPEESLPKKDKSETSLENQLSLEKTIIGNYLKTNATRSVISPLPLIVGRLNDLEPVTS